MSLLPEQGSSLRLFASASLNVSKAARKRGSQRGLRLQERAVMELRERSSVSLSSTLWLGTGSRMVMEDGSRLLIDGAMVSVDGESMVQIRQSADGRSLLILLYVFKSMIVTV